MRLRLIPADRFGRERVVPLWSGVRGIYPLDLPLMCVLRSAAGPAHLWCCSRRLQLVALFCATRCARMLRLAPCSPPTRAGIVALQSTERLEEVSARPGGSPHEARREGSRRDRCSELASGLSSVRAGTASLQRPAPQAVRSASSVSSAQGCCWPSPPPEGCRLAGLLTP